MGGNPTDRGKAGSKRSILVDAGGGPLSLVVAGANVHDTRLLAMTLERVVVERTLAGMPKCRATLVRCDKKVSNYIGQIQLGCVLLWFRRQRQLKF